MPIDGADHHVPKTAFTEARDQLIARLNLGRVIVSSQIESLAMFEEVVRSFDNWDSYNRTLIKHLLPNGIDTNGYDVVNPSYINRPLEVRINLLMRHITTKINWLEGFLDRLPLYFTAYSEAQAANRSERGRNVFIVHGRDVATREAVARVVERLGLQPVILAEQADQGRTIIEKFTDNADGAGFAIVLLTPDDEGRVRSDTDLKPRARQNVILELGFFLGKLGSKRVCALYSGDLELPSDMSGRLYIELDPAGAWMLRLVREMDAAGIQVDANRLYR